MDIFNAFGPVSLGSSTLDSSAVTNGGAISITSETDTVTSSGTIGSGRTVGAGLSLGNSGNISIGSDSMNLSTVCTAQAAGTVVGASGTIMLTSDVTDVVAGLVDSSVSSGGTNNGSGTVMINSAADINVTTSIPRTRASAATGAGTLTLTSTTSEPSRTVDFFAR